MSRRWAHDCGDRQGGIGDRGQQRNRGGDGAPPGRARDAGGGQLPPQRRGGRGGRGRRRGGRRPRHGRAGRRARGSRGRRHARAGPGGLGQHRCAGPQRAHAVRDQAVPGPHVGRAGRQARRRDACGLHGHAGRPARHDPTGLGTHHLSRYRTQPLAPRGHDRARHGQGRAGAVRPVSRAGAGLARDHRQRRRARPGGGHAHVGSVRRGAHEAAGGRDPSRPPGAPGLEGECRACSQRSSVCCAGTPPRAHSSRRPWPPHSFSHAPRP